MSDFNIAIEKTLRNEGGDAYTETEGDNGGATKYGISLKFLSRDVYDEQHQVKKTKGTQIERLFLKRPSKDTIKSLTETEAKLIYKIFFWDANRYGEIEDQEIAEKVFDMSVLMGAPSANKCLQNSLQFGNSDGVKADGIIGNKTLEAINSRYEYSEEWSFLSLERHFINHFRAICNKNKSQSKFLLGWLNRVMS